jgi:hypothetical protein
MACGVVPDQVQKKAFTNLTSQAYNARRFQLRIASQDVRDGKDNSGLPILF